MKTTHHSEPRRLGSSFFKHFGSSVALGPWIVAAHNRVPMKVREFIGFGGAISLCICGIVGAS